MPSFSGVTIVSLIHAPRVKRKKAIVPLSKSRIAVTFASYGSLCFGSSLTTLDTSVSSQRYSEMSDSESLVQGRSSSSSSSSRPTWLRHGVFCVFFWALV